MITRCPSFSVSDLSPDQTCSNKSDQEPFRSIVNSKLQKIKFNFEEVASIDNSEPNLPLFRQTYEFFINKCTEEDEMPHYNQILKK